MTYLWGSGTWSLEITQTPCVQFRNYPRSSDSWSSRDMEEIDVDAPISWQCQLNKSPPKVSKHHAMSFYVSLSEHGWKWNIHEYTAKWQFINEFPKPAIASCPFATTKELQTKSAEYAEQGRRFHGLSALPFIPSVQTGLCCAKVHQSHSCLEYDD